jgi:hypothetical protein
MTYRGQIARRDTPAYSRILAELASYRLVGARAEEAIYAALVAKQISAAQAIDLQSRVVQPA